MMADDTETGFVRRSVRKVSQNSYIQLRNAKLELREKVRKVSAILKKPEHERSCADKALVRKNPDVVKTSQKNAKRRKDNKDRLLEIEDESVVLQEKCEKLAELIRSSEYVVVYTGAGISTAASIPDYRGPNGVWTLLKKGQELCPQDLSDAEPTYTHMSLTKLFRVKKVKHIVSQNCDGLHVRSGFPRYSLSELHGNMYIEMCYNCAPHREYVRLFDVTERTRIRRHTTSRRCKTCGVHLTDTIVHFGEKGKLRAPYRWKEAVRAAKKADLILCLGSSLKVLKKYTCLWSMDKKPQHRPNLAIVNLQWTPKDDVATLKINGRCDEVMSTVMNLLEYDVPEYQKEMDPIFRICTPLRASELKTTCKKILVPPTELAKPPRQTKVTKAKKEVSEKYEVKLNEDVKGEAKAMSVVQCGERKTTGLPVVTECDPLKLEMPLVPQGYSSELLSSTAHPLSSPKFSNSSTLLLGHNYKVEEKFESDVQKSLPSKLKTQVKSGYSTAVVISSPCQNGAFNPPAVTSTCHLLTETRVEGSQQLQQPAISVSAIELRQSSIPNSMSSIETLVSVSNTDPNDCVLLDTCPSLVVVNLDVETPASPLIPTLLVQESSGSGSRLDNSVVQSAQVEVIALSSADSIVHSKVVCDKDNSTAYPVMLSCLNEAGELFSVPVSSLAEPIDDPACGGSTNSDSASLSEGLNKESISLDHPYSHLNNKLFFDGWNPHMSPHKDNSVRTADSIYEAMNMYCDKDSIKKTESTMPPSAMDYKTLRHLLETKGSAQEVRGLLSEKPRSKPATSVKQPEASFHTGDVSYSQAELCNFDLVKPHAQHTTAVGVSGGDPCIAYPKPVAATSCSVSLEPAPMCVLNMDDMESVYKPESVCTTSLELLLPAGCEVLTMDIPTPNQQRQLTDSGSSLLWSLGNTESSMVLNSILSSDVEPVVCNLGLGQAGVLSDLATTAKSSPAKTDAVWSVSLDDVAHVASTVGALQTPETMEGTYNRSNLSPGHNYKEVKKLVKDFDSLYSSDVFHNDRSSPPSAGLYIEKRTNLSETNFPITEERIPLSPRASTSSVFSGVVNTSIYSPSHQYSVADTKTYSQDVELSKSVEVASERKQQKRKRIQLVKAGKAESTKKHAKIVQAKHSSCENFCKKVCKPKPAPSSIPGWFGQGLGLKKKRK